MGASASTFEAVDMARRWPDHAAISIGQQIMTYGQLWQSVAAAHDHFKARNLRGTQVALLTGKSFETYSSLLGLYYAGVNIVLISTDQPVLRAHKQLIISGTKHILFSQDQKAFVDELVLSHQNRLHEEQSNDGSKFMIDSERDDVAFAFHNATEILHHRERQAQIDISTLQPPTEGSMYVAFTSGSTGEPKAAQISVQNFKALIDSIRSVLKWQHGDRVSQAYSLNFDPSLVDVFYALSVGATIYPLLRDQHYDVFHFINENQLTVWSSTPTLIQLQYQHHNQRDQLTSLPTLRQTIFTGETLQSSLVHRLRKQASQSLIYNFYGPVEGTVWATYHLCENDELNTGDVDQTDRAVSIGRPLKNMFVSLDREIGELVLSGPQIFEGYLDQSLNSKQSHYATGDLAHKDNEGNLHLTGRIDFQIKIAGQRISLLEIEALVLKNFGVGLCACLPVYKNQMGPNSVTGVALVLHQNVKDQKHFDLQKVQRCLASHLPSVAVPKQICFVDNWPLTNSGKLDRMKLLQISQNQHGLGA
jgi:acyl-coenzyme A synthetase/AMP-(fatty) acid ligase